MIPLWLLGVIYVYVTLAFVCGVYSKNNAIADIAYGGGVLVLALCANAWGSNFEPGCVLTVLVTVWSVRLVARIYLKNKGKPEDARYALWRTAWLQKSRTYFFIRRYLQVFILQGVVIGCVALPVVIANLYATSDELSTLFLVGAALWVVGFFFESVADYQLDTFIASAQKKGQIMQGGLWQYSRHPNYFGESLMWCGIALAAQSVVPYGILTALCFASPLLITYLLLFVSGIPMLETQMAGRAGWLEYTQRTNAFFPWKPKK